MATTYTDNGGGAANGSDLEFTFTFPVIQTEDVKVALNSIVQATTKYAVNLSSNPTKITFNNTSITSSLQETSGAPKSGVSVRVFRQTTVGKTNGDEDPKAVFAAGSSIRAIDLNANQEQALYAIHELQDQPLTDQDIEDGAITSTKIQDGTIANVDVSSTAAIDGTKISPDFGSQNIATTGTVDGRDVSVDGTKLDTVETNAKDDQTAAEIRTLVESASDSNVFTDADHTKLNGIETAATADQTNAEIKTAYEANANTNEFSDAEQTKLAGIETAATADQTVGEIKTLIAGSPLDASHLAANSVTTSEIADAELTTLASMQSGTASILASGTALTSTTTELNQLDGKTLGETTLSTTSDTAIPTSKAVSDFVSGIVAPLGGLEVISNEVSFPNTQPAAGVVISISDAGGVVFSGSGSSTTGRTVGGSTVTINNAPSSLNSETLVAGVGLMVSSTGAGQIYNYHKILGKEDDIKQLSDDINDFNARYRVGTQNPTTDNHSGDMFFNTATGKMLVYNGVNSAWEEVQSIGNFFISTFSESFDNNRTQFTVANAPTNAQQLIISINGVVQKPNSGTGQPSEGFTLSGSTVTFSAAIPSGSDYFVIVLGSTVNIGTPSNNTVGASQLQNGQITNTHIAANAAIDASKIANLSTDSITEGNSKAEVIGTSSGGNQNSGEFKVDLQDSGSSSGTALRLYKDGSYNITELNNGNVQSNSELRLTHSTATNNWSVLKFNRIGAYPGSSTIRSNGYSYMEFAPESNGTVRFRISNTGTYFQGNLYSWADSTYDIGTSTNRFANIYADTLYGDGSNLTGISTSPTADTGGAIFQNSQTISANHTIPVGSNGMSAGPVTVNNGISLTISNGSTYTIV
nr:hypothetical protein [uncultured Mediterranean phage uvMED]